MFRHRLTLCLLFSLATLALASTACAAPPAAAKSEVPPPAPTQLKVAFLNVGDEADGGWTAHWYHALKQARAHFGDKVAITTVDNITENADSIRVLNELVQRGNRLIFATSYGYNPYVAEVAQQFPDVKFVQATGAFHPDIHNMAVVNEAIDQAWYLAGMAVGGYLRDHGLCRIGMVIPNTMGELRRDATAFVLGARRFAPCAELRTVNIEAWYNIEKERAAAQALIDAKVAVITRGVDSTTTEALAQDYHIPAVGSKAPSTFPVLTNATYGWDRYTREQIQAVLDGKWTATDAMLTFANEGVDLVGWDSKLLPEDAHKLVEEYRAKFKSGWDGVFAGPIPSHNQGELCVPAGITLNRQQLRNDYNCWGAGIVAPD